MELLTSDPAVLCVHCRADVTVVRDERGVTGLRCPAGHRFDAARQGYVNLLVGRGSRATPDGTEMILARERVQDAGVFSALSRTLHEVTAPWLDAVDRPVIVDCGAGTGHYLRPLIAERPGAAAVALDLSPAALRRAAKIPGVLALTWDIWRGLPLADGSVDLILDIFAPRHPSEFRRVLRDGGAAVVVTPGAEHLAELADAGLLSQQEDKAEALAAAMEPHLGTAVDSRDLRRSVRVTPTTAVDLVMMGPAGHHRTRDAVEPLTRGLVDDDAVTLTIDLRISVFAP
ncbi:MAG: methyltransferase domain-containing protein [Nesterenkonia sp.]|nr:methyltransferase domain-containing protein [Nesterenkonia sp.]